MKKISIIAILIVSALSVQAQRFEWAKGYTVSQNSYRSIVGGITDSLGNLYILGHCDASSVWDGAEYVLPSINKTAKDLPNSVLIAKINTEGEMAWKKVVFSRSGNTATDIKKIGDTAFACMFNFSPPKMSTYTYYLDTFLYGMSNYPIDISHFATGTVTAYLVFDFDGNILEQHYLWITYTDADGNDIVTHIPYDTIPILLGHSYENVSFDTDSEGNIYINRRAYDYCSSDSICTVENGAICGLKFWVDRRLAGEYRVEGERKQGYPQILKFSPHFDTLLACRNMVQRLNTRIDKMWKTITKVDKHGNLYCIPVYDNTGALSSADTILLDSLRHIEFVNNTWTFSFLMSYDNNLNARWIISYDDHIFNGNVNNHIFKQFYDIDFDYDSNLVFLSATSGRTTAGDTLNYMSTLTYRGRLLPLKDGVSIASFYNTDSIPVMHSYSVVPAIKSAQISGHGSSGNLYCKNNRVVLQCDYFGGIRLPSQTIRYNTLYHSGIGLLVYDYIGNLIDGIDYDCVLSNCITNYPGPIVAHDSVLYLCNLLVANAQFGDISFPVYGETNVIAKYVDTAFMHPYVRPTHGISTAAAVAPRVYPVPATDRLHFDCPAGDVPTAVAAISLSGWRMPLTATASSADVSCLAPGVYILEITTAKDKYYTKFVKQ